MAHNSAERTSEKSSKAVSEGERCRRVSQRGSGEEQITGSLAGKILAFTPVKWGSSGDCEWWRDMI